MTAEWIESPGWENSGASTCKRKWTAEGVPILIAQRENVIESWDDVYWVQTCFGNLQTRDLNEAKAVAKALEPLCKADMSTLNMPGFDKYVRDVMRRLNRHRERYLRAFVARYHVDQDKLLQWHQVQQTHADGRVTWHLERATGVCEHCGRGPRA